MFIFLSEIQLSTHKNVFLINNSNTIFVITYKCINGKVSIHISNDSKHIFRLFSCEDLYISVIHPSGKKLDCNKHIHLYRKNLGYTSPLIDRVYSCSTQREQTVGMPLTASATQENLKDTRNLTIIPNP